LKGGQSSAQPNAGIAVWDNFASGTSSETVLPLSDYTVNWSNRLISSGVYSGITEQTSPSSVDIGLPSGGPSGSNYNGITSVLAYDFSGFYAYVKIVNGPPNGTADQMMLTLPKDSANHYRVYLTGGSTNPTISLEKKVGGV